MPRNNSTARREQRRATAQANARRQQVDCGHCGRRHREGRCFRNRIEVMDALDSFGLGVRALADPVPADVVEACVDAVAKEADR